MPLKEAVDFADESMEAVSYYALQASHGIGPLNAGLIQVLKAPSGTAGLLPIDTIELLEKERGGYLDMDRSSRMDWSPLRAAIKQTGLRNSLVMAIAPTATIGNITGVTQSIEPMYKNVFVKSNLSGEFTVINECLGGRP